MAAKKLNINYYRKPEKKERRNLTYGYIVQYSKTDAAFFIAMGVRAKESEIPNHVNRIDKAFKYMIETAELKK